MEPNESKISHHGRHGHKQAQHSFGVIHAGGHSLSDPIFPFATTALFPSPTRPDHDSATDDNDRLRASSNPAALLSGERRLKRMISNRESARRSRMRRKMQVEELQFLVGQLQTTNRQLSEKLIQLLDCNQQVLHENSQLKEKLTSLQMLLSDFLVPLRGAAVAGGAEDHHSSGCGERALGAQGSSTAPSVTISSMQLLHN